MPRVSRPAAPASARKQGVSAVRRSGSSSSSVIASRTRLVSETSAVGISQHPAGLDTELVVGELRQLAGAEHRLVAHEERRADLGVAVLHGLLVEHELAERPLQPGETLASGPRSGRPRAWPRPRSPSGRAPRRARRAPWARRVVARGAMAVELDIGVLVGAVRHVRQRLVGDRGERARASLASTARSSSSSTGVAALRAATSAIRACALASSLRALAWPISLEAALRRSWAAWSLAISLRRRSSRDEDSRRREARGRAARNPRRRDPDAHGSTSTSCIAESRRSLRPDGR